MMRSAEYGHTSYYAARQYQIHFTNQLGLVGLRHRQRKPVSSERSTFWALPVALRPSILSSCQCYVTCLQHRHYQFRVFVPFSGVPLLPLTRPGSHHSPTCDFRALTPIIEPTCTAKSFYD